MTRTCRPLTDQEDRDLATDLAGAMPIAPRDAIREILEATRARIDTRQIAIDYARKEQAQRRRANLGAQRAHGYHQGKGEWIGHETWHDCPHPLCQAARLDAVQAEANNRSGE
jgi:hypothetical protein